MDENAIQHLSCGGDPKTLPIFEKCVPTTFKKSSHSVEVFRSLLALRKDEMFCDIKLETDDGSVVLGHKAVLASASPYFRDKFTNIEESYKSHIKINQIDFTDLELSINFMYSGEIVVTQAHVQGLLAAANLLQLDYIKTSCATFLLRQLNPSNCLAFRNIGSLHNCTELMSTSDAYIKKKFSQVVKYDDFLSLSPERLIQLVSCSDLTVPFEEVVYESVMTWIKHNVVDRKQFLPELIEHVRLPLMSKRYLLLNVSEEPLLKNNPKCKDYVHEAIHFHLLKTIQIMTIKKAIQYKPRQPSGLQKVILILSHCLIKRTCLTNLYDPANNICQFAVDDMNKNFLPSHLILIADQYVITVGRISSAKEYCIARQSIQMLDLFSPISSWEPIVNMLVDRDGLGIGVLNNSIYAVGGENGFVSLKSAEVFDVNLQKWRMISSMSFRRSHVAVGVLNNLLYAVGGYDTHTKEKLSSVECYDPSLNKWTRVAELCRPRSHFSIGVLDGVMYAVGGTENYSECKSVEAYRPSVGRWTLVADLHIGTVPKLVVALDGLLYVLSHANNSKYGVWAQIYNPNTNTWEVKETPFDNVGLIYAAVGIDRQPNFKTD